MTPLEQRSIEDRLLVIETKLDHLATKAELVGTKSDLIERIDKLRDDLRVWYIAGWSTLLIAVVVSHFVK